MMLHMIHAYDVYLFQWIHRLLWVLLNMKNLVEHYIVLKCTIVVKKGALTKKIIVYVDGFDSYGMNALGKYYISTVADKTYMPKIDNLFFDPITIDYPFINDTLSKLSMEVEVRRREEFKSALNMFMRKKFDKYHKKPYNDLLGTIEYNFIQKIAMAHKLRPFKEVTFNIPINQHLLQIISLIQWYYNTIIIMLAGLTDVMDEKQWIKYTCENTNIIQIKIKEFCARIEIAFFPLVFKAIPNTRLVIYILVHFGHLSSIIVAKNMARDDANNNVFNKNKKTLCKVNKSGLIFLFDCILCCNICLINVCCDLYVFFFVEWAIEF